MSETASSSTAERRASKAAPADLPPVIIARDARPPAVPTPDGMGDAELVAYLESTEFKNRSAAVRRRTARGGDLSDEQMASMLGLPFDFYALCLAQTLLAKQPSAIVLFTDARPRLDG